MQLHWVTVWERRWTRTQWMLQTLRQCLGDWWSVAFLLRYFASELRYFTSVPIRERGSPEVSACGFSKPSAGGSQREDQAPGEDTKPHEKLIAPVFICTCVGQRVCEVERFWWSATVRFAKEARGSWRPGDKCRRVVSKSRSDKRHSTDCDHLTQTSTRASRLIARLPCVVTCGSKFDAERIVNKRVRFSCPTSFV